MADYYSLLAKAVGNLPKTSPPTARKAIYDRARAALIRQLRSLGPTLSEADIAREEAALETAVARLEEQYEAPEPPAASSAAPPPPPPASPPRPAENAVRPPISTASRPAANFPPKPPTFGPPAPPPLRPTLQPGQNPSASNILPPLRPPAPRPPGAPEATLRSPAAAPPLARPLPAQRSAPAPTPPAPPSLPPTPAAPPQTPTAPPPTPVAQRVPPAGDTSAAPPVFASSGLMYESEAEAPLIEPGIDADRGPRNGASDGDSLRPSAPTRFEAPSANPLPWVLLAVVVGLVLSIAVAAFLLRQKPQDLAIKEPAPVSDAQPEANAPKIAERVGGGDTPAPTPTPTQSAQAAPSPTPDAAASPAPAASPAATPSAAATPNAAPTAAASATPAPTPATQPAATPALPVAARAAMLIAVGGDPQKPPAVSLGSVVWTLIPAAPGQPASVAVKAETDIPDLKMHAIMTIRKNTDASLPASHTIDLRVTFADSAEIKGVKDIRVPLMRRDDPPSQDSLSGVRVKISDSYFLVGLNRNDVDISHNIDLMANRGWFDFPMLLNDDRIAKLTFEKGADGDRILNQALAAWK